jgi:glycosyltransferase involved in cell wall biosynthesis
VTLNNIRISVIVPIYNVEDYLKETIESLIFQSFNKFEIIIVDDKSTDNSYKIAAHFATIDSRIVLIQQDENKGVSAARNVGIKRAQGQFIFFLDGDDTIPYDTLERMYEAAIIQNSDIITGVYERFDSKVKAPANFFNQFPELKEEGIISIYSCPALLYSVYSCGKLFKRELIQNERFLDELEYGEDQVFTISAFLRSRKIYNLSSTVYNYRVREGSQSQSVYVNPVRNLKNLFVMLSELHKIFNQLIADEISSNKLFSIYFSRALHWNVWTAISNGVLSYNVPTRVQILDAYMRWMNEVPDYLFETNRQDFILINLKLDKIMEVVDSATRQSYINLVKLIKTKLSL